MNHDNSFDLEKKQGTKKNGRRRPRLSMIEPLLQIIIIIIRERKSFLIAKDQQKMVDIQSRQIITVDGFDISNFKYEHT